MDGAVALGTFIIMLCKGTPHLIMIKIMNNYFSSESKCLVSFFGNDQTLGPYFLSETLTFCRILKCLTILSRKDVFGQYT